MKSWHDSIEKAKKHTLYRCERLCETHNPDYINKHGKFNKSETELRIKKEAENRFKANTPSNSITPIRMNKQK